ERTFSALSGACRHSCPRSKPALRPTSSTSRRSRARSRPGTRGRIAPRSTRSSPSPARWVSSSPAAGSRCTRSFPASSTRRDSRTGRASGVDCCKDWSPSPIWWPSRSSAPSSETGSSGSSPAGTGPLRSPRQPPRNRPPVPPGLVPSAASGNRIGLSMDPSPSPSEVARVADFRAALRAFLRKSERNARQSGLTPQRYLLLLMIKGAPDGSEQSTVTELAERLQLAQSTVTELVRRAEETGLVEREQSASDGRVAHLRLTPEGERRLTRAFTSNEQERQELRAAIAHIE